MMGRNHARVLHAHSTASSSSPSPTPRATRTAWPAAPTVVDTVDELIALGIDIAVVAVPTAFHLEAGLELAAAGVHTLIEKPLATDAERGPAARRRLRAAPAWSTPSATSSAATRRCGPCARGSTNGDLGDIYQVATRRQGPFPNRIADVGVVKDLATHDIDLTAWVIQSPYASLGAAPPTRAAASTRT